MEKFTFSMLLLIVVEATTSTPPEVQRRYAKWKISLDGLPDAAITSTQNFSEPNPALNVSKSIRLVDWHEWQLMRRLSADASDQTPMLIVGAAEPELSRRAASELPEAESIEQQLPESLNHNQTNRDAKFTNLTTPLIEFSTSIPLSTTSLSLESSTPTKTDATTTPKVLETFDSLPSIPVPPLDLKNLPNLFHLLKQLTVIPTLVKSFSGTGTGDVYSGNNALTSSAVPHGAAANLLQMFTGSALNGGSAPSSGSEIPVFHSKALSSTNSEYRNPLPLPNESRISEEPSFQIPARNSFNADPTPRPPLPESNLMLKPIVPVLTTYDSGKIRKPSSMKLNEETRFNRLNIYGIEHSGRSAAPEKYIAPLAGDVDNEETMNRRVHPEEQKKRKERPKFDLSELTVNEVEQLESIHRRLFNPEESSSISSESSSTKAIDESGMISHSSTPENIRFPEYGAPTSSGRSSTIDFGSVKSAVKKPEPNLIVFQRPSEGHPPPPTMFGTAGAFQSMLGSSSLAPNFKLSPEELNELTQIKDLPDLDELTQGMDLSLLTKPGGFATLKKQFMERWIQRTLGKRKRKQLRILRDDSNNN